jgi:hypothetical protein
MSNIPTWLTVILAPGAAGFVWVLFKGLDLWRNNTSAQEARAIKNLERYAEREAYRADRNQDLLDYYRNRAGHLEWVIRTTPGMGPDMVPPAPPLPEPPPRLVEHNRRSTDVQTKK